METEEIWRYVDSERAALASLLSGLSASEWDTPSVCPGWKVRDVAAHVISSPQAKVWPVVTGMIRARGDFNRFVFEDARRLGARYSGEEIVAQYGEFAGSRRHPPGTTPADPLLDVLIHTQDIAVPLGIERRMPVEAARAAADRIWTKSFPFKAQKKLSGLKLVASDIDWTVGEGKEIHGSMEALLLLVSGRKTSKLTGAGVSKL